MKKIALVAALAVAVASLAIPSAYAADVPQGPSPHSTRSYVAQPAPQTWQGLYVGLVGGANWSDATGTAYIGGVNVGSASASQSGWSVGGNAAYLWQSGRFVFGPELELATGKDNPWSLTARGLLGLDMGRVMPYIGAGVTMAKLDFSIPTAAWSENRTGWNVAGGVKFALTPSWVAGLEYRYTDLGSGDHDLPPATLKTSIHTQSLLATVAYKF